MAGRVPRTASRPTGRRWSLGRSSASSELRLGLSVETAPQRGVTILQTSGSWLGKWLKKGGPPIRESPRRDAYRLMARVRRERGSGTPHVVLEHFARLSRHAQQLQGEEVEPDVARHAPRQHDPGGQAE